MQGQCNPVSKLRQTRGESRGMIRERCVAGTAALYYVFCMHIELQPSGSGSARDSRPLTSVWESLCAYSVGNIKVERAVKDGSGCLGGYIFRQLEIAQLQAASGTPQTEDSVPG